MLISSNHLCIPLSHLLTANRSSVASSVVALRRPKLPSRATPTLHVMPLLAGKNWRRHSLPAMSLYGEKEWYFFSPRDQKYLNGSRSNRAAGTGYWKATGAGKPLRKPRTLGIKKALVFYAGKAPRGVKTNWIVHEYRLANVDQSTGKFTDMKLVVDTSRGGKLRINFDVTFPAIPCTLLSLDAMDISGEQHLNIKHNIFKKRIDSHGNVIDTRQDGIGAPKIERPLQRHGGRLEHNEKYCGSCFGEYFYFFECLLLFYIFSCGRILCSRIDCVVDFNGETYGTWQQ